MELQQSVLSTVRRYIYSSIHNNDKSNVSTGAAQAIFRIMCMSLSHTVYLGKSTSETLLSGKHNAVLSASAGTNKRLLSERTETSLQVRQWEYRERGCARLLQHPKS